MFQKLLNLFRDKAPTKPAERASAGLSYEEFVKSSGALVKGYRFSATLQPHVPLSILRRHGELRTKVPESETMNGSPLYLWTAEVDDALSFLDEGATMSSSVGPVPTDGGDFLPFLIHFREIVEAPRNPALSEFNDVLERMQKIRGIPTGFGYVHDDKFNLLKGSAKGEQGDYHDILFGRNSEWLPMFLLSELSSHSFDGLNWAHIDFLRQQGFGSILEILAVEDAVLLSVKGIGKKRLERIRNNKRRV